jgi:hypothetical protein
MVNEPLSHTEVSMAKDKRDDLDNGDAFLPDPRRGSAPVRDTLAELVGEEFVSSATAGEEAYEDQRNEVTLDELGGPFVEVSAEEELAVDHDASNPEDATREPFPTTKTPRE